MEEFEGRYYSMIRHPAFVEGQRRLNQALSDAIERDAIEAQDRSDAEFKLQISKVLPEWLD